MPPGLALDIPECPPHPASNTPLQDTKSLLDSLLGDGFLWAALPKHRRSLERRMSRRMGGTKIRKFTTPKKNIVACLECGHWHESHTICGKENLNK